MRINVTDKDDRLEITLFFPDSRLTDLESALRLASDRRWTFHTISKGIDHLEYKLTDKDAFLTEVRFTHGLEPPTRVLFENRQPETGRHQPAHKRTVIAVTKEFLEECANRGLVSQVKKDLSVKQLERHDPELAQTR